MNSDARHPLNSSGKYFCTFYENEDDFTYVHRQPENDYETEVTEELILDCPAGSIVGE